MAKRKRRLNKRLLLIVVLVGGLLLAGGGYGAYRARLYRKIFPKNPEACLRAGEAAQQRGDWEEAEKRFGEAIIYAPNTPAKAEYFYRYARLMADWIEAKGEELPRSKRSQLSDRSHAALYNAILQDPNHLAAQQMLTDRAWAVASYFGQWMVFIKEADSLLRLKPNDDKLVFMRALAWSAMARAVPGANSDNAIADFRRAMELKGDNPTYRLEYAQFLRDEQRWDEAFAAYEDAISKIPDDGDLRVRYASLLIERNRADEGMAQIRQAVEKDTDNPAGYIALGDRLMADRQTDAALEAFDKAKQIDDSDYRIYYMMSLAYRQQKEVDKAISSLREGLAMIEKRLAETSATAPGNEMLLNHLTLNRWQLKSVLANTLLDEVDKSADNAASYMAEAKKLLDETEWPLGAKGQQDKLAGRIAFLEGDMTKALPLLEQSYTALGPDPAVAEALINVYLRKDLPGKAEQILDRMRRTPAFANSPVVLLTKARLEMKYRDFEQAQQYVEQVLRADPNNAEAKRLRVEVAVAQGQMPAEETLSRQDLSPAVIQAMLGRASDLWGQGQRDEAIAIVEQVHKKVPDNRTASSALLLAYVNTDNTAKAKALLEEIKAASPERAAALELQEKLIGEEDLQKRLDLMLQLADQNQDPLPRALAKANICAEYNQLDRQGEYLQEAYKLDPNNPIVIEQMFRYALSREDWARAEEFAAKAAAGNLDQTGGKVFSAQLAMAKNLYPQAIELLTQAANERPDLKTTWLLLGHCQLQVGDLEKAEKVFTTLAQADPGYVPALVAMAMITEKQRKTTEHAEWVERAHRLAPNNDYIKRQYLLAMEETGKSQEAIAQRERILQAIPADMDNCAHLAKLYEQADEPDKAEKMYATLYANSPNKLAAAHDLAGFYTRIGRLSDANKVLVEQLQNWPDKVAAYIVYGDFLAGISPPQARAAMEKAIEMDPNDPRGPRALAVLLSRNRDWAGAAEALTKYMELQPNDVAARADLIRYQLQARQLDQAQQQIDAALAANPADPDLLALKGDLAVQQGDVTKALATYESVLRINPDHIPALVGQANAYLIQGKMTEGKAALTKAKAASNSPRIAMALAELHQRLGDLDMAQMYLREVLDRGDSAEYAVAVRRLLMIYYRQQRWQRVAELLTEAKAKFPNDPSYLLAEAEMYAQTGDQARAVQSTEAALRLASNSQQVLRSYLLALVAAGDYRRVLATADNYAGRDIFGPIERAIRARALVKLGQAARADEEFLAALKDAPGVDLQFVVGQVKQAYGLNVTLAKMVEWVRTRPDEAALHYILGALYSEAQEHAKAVEAFTKASSLAESQPALKAAAEKSLGLAYYAMGKMPEAEKAYLAALQYDAGDPTTLNNLAYMYTNDMNQADKALPFASKAAALVSDNPDVLDTYAWSLAKCGSYGQAERELLRVIQISETPATTALARYHLGWVYEQTGQLEEAARHYRLGDEALRDQPGDPLHKDISEALLRIQNAQTMK